jgi:hypothetical protein
MPTCTIPFLNYLAISHFFRKLSKETISNTMKNLLLMGLMAFAFLAARGQSLPSKGDYVMIGHLGEDYSHYIYPKGAKVFYGYSIQQKSCENAYKTSSSLVKELFAMMREYEFMSLQGLQASDLPLPDGQDNPYRVMIAEMDGKVHEVIWDYRSKEGIAVVMERLAAKVSEFW